MVVHRITLAFLPMAEKVNPVSVRLPARLGRRFLALRQRIDLPASVILRLLVAPQLEKPIEDQVSIVLSQVQRTQPLRRTSPAEDES